VRAPRTAARPSAAARPRGATSRPPAARRRSWGPAEGQQILAIYEANPQFLEVILKAIEDMEQWKRAKKRKSKRGLLQSDDSETQGVGTVCSTYATDGSSTTGCTASLTPVDGTGGTGGTVGSSENKCYDFTYCTGDRGYTGCICPDGTTPPNSSCDVSDIPGASCYTTYSCTGSCNNDCGTASNPQPCCGDGYPSGCTAL
jgi:hypothetical protein